MSNVIIMIHGMWSGPWIWDNYKPFFENKDYLCITPTLRYHQGESDTAPDPRLGTLSLSDYVDDLERLVQKFATPPILMGHFMGGLLAQMLAERGRAKAVVLLAPAPPSGIISMRPSVIKSFRSALTTWGFWKKPMKQTFEEAVYAYLGEIPVEERKAIYNRMGYESGRAGCEIGFWYLDYKKTTKIDESKITCPMLIMAGARDNLTPVAVTRKVADKYKAVATYKEYENHAHLLFSEPGWEKSAHEISAWMRQVSMPEKADIKPKNEQREHKRIEFQSPVIYSTMESPVQHQSEIDNYSLKGVKLVSAVPLVTGSNIDLKLLGTAPGFDGPLENRVYTAEVVWCKGRDLANNYDVGLMINYPEI